MASVLAACAAVPPLKPAAPTPVAATPGAPKPFADVIKDAQRIDGLFPVWQKDDKTWLEIPAERLDQPFFLSIGLTRGLGERWLIGGLQGGSFATGGEYIGQFRKAGSMMQLLAINTRFTARTGSPEERAVKNAYSDSLLASAPVVSAPHPERKSVLIEATALLLADIPRAAHVIEREYRNSYAFDTRNSYIRSAKASNERTVLDVTAHYQQSRIPLPPQAGAGSVPLPFNPPPAVLEDPRSLFLGFLYTFSRLPEQPMTPRVADSRIGHFTVAKLDFSAEDRASPMRHYVQRWRLEKKDPQAALSEPVKPITYWLGNEIPEKYRAPIRDGVLAWNQAFEKIGFREAIVVRQQPDDSDVDLLETGHSSVRWQITARPSYGAIGPSHVDPRSGEILDADLAWDANFVRNARFLRSEELAYRSMYDESTGDVRLDAFAAHDAPGVTCALRELAQRELGYTLALLEARGELDPDSPQAEAFIADFIRWVTMHEVGHTLGLAHNFRASTVNTPRQLADAKYTRAAGLLGSVMDYPPANIALAGETQGQYYSATLGAYDYWAIDYAYRPIASADGAPPADAEQTQRAERGTLRAIAARAGEPQLAFATDVDAIAAIDPTANVWDLGSDPLAFYRKRVLLTQELWMRLESRTLKPGESYSVLRRRFLSGLDQASLAMTQAAKYIGGAELQNTVAGGERLPITPVSAKQQREALAVITMGLFRLDSFRLSPEFMRKLAADRLERADLPLGAQISVLEVALPDRVLAVQRDVLNRLMGPVVARRMLVNAEMSGRHEAFTLAELYATLQASIWTEARSGIEASVIRRNLQREHLRRVSAALLGPSAGFPADARTLMKADARRLHGWLVAAAAAPGLSAETRAHYADAAATLADVMKAPLYRTGV